MINHASDDADLVFFGSWQTQSPRPRFQGVENDHGPIEQAFEALEALDQVQGESIGWAWRDPEERLDRLARRLGRRLAEGL